MLATIFLLIPQTAFGGSWSQEPLDPSLRTALETEVAIAERTVVFKLQDGLSAYADAGRLTGDSPELQAILDRLHGLDVQHAFFDDDRGRLAAVELRNRALERGATDVADLTLYFEAYAGDPAAAGELETWLRAQPQVEHAYRKPTPAPPPADRPPPSPTWVDQQNYFGPAGVDLQALSGVLGATGNNVRVTDCEYSWAYDHEDLELNRYRIVGRRPVGTPGGGPFYDHGAAVIALLYAQNNEYGITGGVPDCDIWMSSQWTESGVSAKRAILRAAEHSRRNDIILLEMQAEHVDGEYLPVEWSPGTFDIIKAAVEGGIHVIAASGNGGANLDDPKYGGAFDVAVRDSGAILVGAGSSAQRLRLAFSNYGERVDCHAWGEHVISAGYGDLFYPADPLQAYTDDFGGSSSAAAIVAASAASLLGAMKAHGMTLPTPSELREALRTLGTPQEATDEAIGRIGPMPRLEDLFDHFGVPTGLRSPREARLGAAVTFELDGNPGEHWTLSRSMSTDLRSTQAGVDVLGTIRHSLLASGSLDAAGVSSFSSAVPNRPGLAGRRVYFQASIGLGVSSRLSNGGAMLLCQ